MTEDRMTAMKSGLAAPVLGVGCDGIDRRACAALKLRGVIICSPGGTVNKDCAPKDFPKSGQGAFLFSEV